MCSSTSLSYPVTPPKGENRMQMHTSILRQSQFLPSNFPFFRSFSFLPSPLVRLRQISFGKPNQAKEREGGKGERRRGESALSRFLEAVLLSSRPRRGAPPSAPTSFLFPTSFLSFLLSYPALVFPLLPLRRKGCAKNAERKEKIPLPPSTKTGPVGGRGKRRRLRPPSPP